MTRPHTHGGTDAPECRSCEPINPRQEWPVGQLAEVDWRSPLDETVETFVVRRALPNNAAAIYRDYWETLDEKWLLQDGPQVTAIRPLRLVPADAIVLDGRTAALLSRLVEDFRAEDNELTGSIDGAVAVAEEIIATLRDRGVGADQSPVQPDPRDAPLDPSWPRGDGSTAADLLRRITANDPERHRVSLGRGYSAGVAAEPGSLRLCDRDGVIRRGPLHHGQDRLCPRMAHLGATVVRCSNRVHANTPLTWAALAEVVLAAGNLPGLSNLCRERAESDAGSGSVPEATEARYAAGHAEPCTAQCARPAGITCAEWGCRPIATPATGTPAEPTTFEQLLADPLEQFDVRSELLPAILRHLCTSARRPDADALVRSIEEYRNAPPAAATTASVVRLGADVPAEAVSGGSGEMNCPHCGSDRRVSASFNGGITVVWQCVPCGTGYPKAAAEAVSGGGGHAEWQETTQRHHLFGYCWCGSVHGEKRQVEALNAARPDELLRSARGEIERLTDEVARCRAAIEQGRRACAHASQGTTLEEIWARVQDITDALAAALGDGEQG